MVAACVCGLRPRATAAAFGRRGLRAGGRRLTAGVRFWCERSSWRRRCAAVVAACACASRWNVGSSEGAAAEGGSKEPKVPWRVRAEPAGRLSLHPVAAAFGRRGLRAGGRRLTAGVRFWCGRSSWRRRCAAVVAACACVSRWNVGSSEGAAAEGGSKEPKVPWRVRAEPAVALLVVRRWACGWVVPTKRSGASAEKCAIAFVRNPSPPESRKRQGRNTPIFQPCRAEPVGRAANFRANLHGAAAKLNAPQAFNAPTCHGNSRNASFNVLPRRVPIHAEPSAVPHTRRTPRFSSLRGEKRESSRNAQRSPPPRSNPRRAIRRSPYS